MAHGVTYTPPWREVSLPYNYRNFPRDSYENTNNTVRFFTCPVSGSQTNLHKVKVFSPTVVYQADSCPSTKVLENPISTDPLIATPLNLFSNDKPSINETRGNRSFTTQQEIGAIYSHVTKFSISPFRTESSFPSVHLKSDNDLTSNFMKWREHNITRQDIALNATESILSISQHSHHKPSEDGTNGCHRSAFHRPLRRMELTKLQYVNDRVSDNSCQGLHPAINAHGAIHVDQSSAFSLLGHFQNSLSITSLFSSSKNTSWSGSYEPRPKYNGRDNNYDNAVLLNESNACREIKIPDHKRLSASKDVEVLDSQHCGSSKRIKHDGKIQRNIKEKRSADSVTKPYKCQCGTTFARNEELTRHQRIHSGYKPHQCPVCNKTFGRKDHLNKHVKTHLHSSQKKVYLCDVPNCEQTYTRSDALARHQTNSHGIKTKPSKWRPQRHSNV